MVFLSASMIDFFVVVATGGGYFRMLVIEVLVRILVFSSRHAQAVWYNFCVILVIYLKPS